MRILGALFLVVIVVVSFQNCGDVHIAQKIQEASAPSIVSVSKPSDTLCAPQGATFGAAVRIVVLLDMSASNIGATNVLEHDTPTPGIINYTYSLDTTGATDLAGQRFEQVKRFIENCGGNANVSYAIIGFAKNSFTPRGNSCLSAFESQADALKSLDALKALQDHDLQIHSFESSNADSSPYYLEDSTLYNTALSCLNQKINEDIALLVDEHPTYHVFFATDGAPTDAAADDQARLQMFQSKISQIKTAVAGANSTLIFQPIFYTSAGAKNAGQLTTAVAELSAMGGNSTLVLNDLETANQQLCQAIKPQSKVTYTLKSMFAVNATALNEQGNVVADSDADGVSDEAEVVLGWNPQNAQSSGVLDGLCRRTGADASACQATLSKLTCSKSATVLGLNDCDRKFASKFFGQTVTAVDTDHDNVPDLVEILKGTSPARDDMLENPGGDGMTNFLKIIQGLDASSSNSTFPTDEKKIMQLTMEQMPDSCEDGSDQFQYVFDQIPLAKVLAYTDSSDDPSLNFSHAQDENVILVISVWQSTGGVQLPDRLYVQKILVPLSGDAKKSPPVLIGDIQ